MKKKTLIRFVGASVYMLSCVVLVVLTTKDLVGEGISVISTAFMISSASWKLASWVYNKLKD